MGESAEFVDAFIERFQSRYISGGSVDPGRIDFERRWRVGRAVGEGGDAPLKLGEFERPSGVTRDSEA